MTGNFDGHSHPSTRVVRSSHPPIEEKLWKDQETWIPPPVLSCWVHFLWNIRYVEYYLEEDTLQDGCDGQESPWLCFILWSFWVLTHKPSQLWPVHLDRASQAQLRPISSIQHSLMSHMETELYFLTFAHHNSNPEALTPKQILKNQPEGQKGFWFPWTAQINPATSTLENNHQTCHSVPRSAWHSSEMPCVPSGASLDSTLQGKKHLH